MNEKTLQRDPLIGLAMMLCGYYVRGLVLTYIVVVLVTGFVWGDLRGVNPFAWEPILRAMFLFGAIISAIGVGSYKDFTQGW